MTGPSTMIADATIADARSVSTLRSLSLDQVQAANSGHIGLPLGAAPILHTLYSRFLISDPGHPNWINRDRFVLSAGHGSALLYATLHLAGYGIGLDDLRTFRQWSSITPGHPESGLAPGVDATTGPLGQGIANAVGMAIAETMAAERLNTDAGTIIDHRTFVLVSDGDLMEGIALEATALAGVLRLGKLIALYDDNDVVIDGHASITHSADAVCGSLREYGWDVSEQIDGNDVEALARALQKAIDTTDKPSLIRVRTTIGFGSSFAGQPKIHSGALAEPEVRKIKDSFGSDFAEPFSVPADVAESWEPFAQRGAEARVSWESELARVHARRPEIVAELRRWQDAAPVTEAQLRSAVDVLDEPEAARFTSARVLGAVALSDSSIVGGAADLAMATMAY
ncbi:MAG: transketolase, partial [Dermatophilaceae bacterium]